MPIPKSSTPALLLTMVRSLVPLRRMAAMRFSGIPQRPKPPMRMVAPSWIFSMAASAEAMRLSIRCSEVFGGSLLHPALEREGAPTDCGKFVEFLGSVEVGFKFADGEFFTHIDEAATTTIFRARDPFIEERERAWRGAGQNIRRRVPSLKRRPR